jgi:hypothetical protein
MRSPLARVCLAIVVGIAPTSLRAADYFESLLGDISGTPEAPSPWLLELGANVLNGAAGVSDYDILAVTVPTGHQLDSLVLDAYQNQSALSFLGLQAGATWTAGVGWSVDGAALKGHDLFGSTEVGQDRLPQIGFVGDLNDNTFTPPLGSGVYSILLQDTQTPFTYQFTFNVSAIPEPATISLAAFGLLWFARLRRDR